MAPPSTMSRLVFRRGHRAATGAKRPPGTLGTSLPDVYSGPPSDGGPDMLLRVRVTLPDRPGTLGQVARTLGVSGADIVQVVVLERLGGRAVDDFTVVWPGAARLERLLAGLAAIPGVQVDGVWKAIGAPVSGGHDAELLAQVAANPADGLA